MLSSAAHVVKYVWCLMCRLACNVCGGITFLPSSRRSVIDLTLCDRSGLSGYLGYPTAWTTTAYLVYLSLLATQTPCVVFGNIAVSSSALITAVLLLLQALRSYHIDQRRWESASATTCVGIHHNPHSTVVVLHYSAV